MEIMTLELARNDEVVLLEDELKLREFSDLSLSALCVSGAAEVSFY